MIIAALAITASAAIGALQVWVGSRGSSSQHFSVDNNCGDISSVLRDLHNVAIAAATARAEANSTRDALAFARNIITALSVTVLISLVINIVLIVVVARGSRNQVVATAPLTAQALASLEPYPRSIPRGTPSESSRLSSTTRVIAATPKVPKIDKTWQQLP